MMTAGEIFENAIIEWGHTSKGHGTALIPHPLNDKVMLLGVLQRVYAKNPEAKTLIVIDKFSERMDIIEFLTHQEEEENNNEFRQLIKDKKIKLLTADFIAKNWYKEWHDVGILYHTNVTQCYLQYTLRACQFKLIIWNKLPDDAKAISETYKVAPLLSSFKQNEIDSIRMNTPIEDIWIDVQLEDEDDRRLLDYYNNYIATTLNIFGSFDIMQQARIGNPTLNISAIQICAQIAQENGWHEHLDKSSEIEMQLDELYNPNNLRIRATETYEIIRSRSQLLSDYKGKLDVILKLVQENKDKKILIISKRGNFANRITEYLNNMSETDICGNYHDYVDSIPAVDINGNPLYYKSGSNKGERRFMGASAQKTLNEQRFNLGHINVLSTTNAPDKSLNAQIDMVIITSPQCERLEDYIYRLSDIYFKDKIILYSIFVKGTLEENKLFAKSVSDNHKIVNKCENSIAVMNNSEFIMVE